MRRLAIILGIFMSISSYAQEPYELKKLADEFKASGKADSAIIYYDASGRGYRNIADFDQAYEVFSEAYHLRDSIGENQDLALSFLYLGIIEGKRGKHEIAGNYFEMAMADVMPMQTNKDSVRVSQALTNLGTTYSELNKLDSAETTLVQAMDMVIALDLPRDKIASILTNLGLNEEKRENWEEALPYYQQAKDIWEQFDDLYDNTLSYQNLGGAHMQLGNLDSAKYYYYKGLRISEANQFDLRKLEIVSSLYDYYSESEIQVDSIKKYADATMDLKETIIESQSEGKINDLRVKYESERLETQVARDKVRIQQATVQTTMLLIAVLVLTIISLVGYLVNKRRMAKREQEFQNINSMLKEQEIEAYNSVLEAQETERKRIAAELHDKLGSTLSAAKLYLNHIEEDQTLQDHELEFKKGMNLLDNAVQDVRTISHAMATGVIGQFGLAAALTELKETINGTGAILIKLHINGLNERLPQQMEVHIYRMIQELVSNALKHSGATEIVIQLTQHPDDINILVEDNGSGFDVHASGGGIGLKNMEQRVSVLHASINIDSYKGRGTTVSIDVPLGE